MIVSGQKNFGRIPPPPPTFLDPVVRLAPGMGGFLTLYERIEGMQGENLVHRQFPGTAISWMLDAAHPQRMWNPFRVHEPCGNPTGAGREIGNGK